MMFTKIFFETRPFNNWGTEHYLVLLGLLILSIAFIYHSKNTWQATQERKIVLWLCAIMILFQVTKPITEYYLGTFELGEDLPLHLCNIMPITLFLAYYKNNRNIWAIFSLWIISGSSHSLFTTTLQEGLPHINAIRYWFVHWGIVILALYGQIVRRWILEWKDIWRSIVIMHIFAMILYPINLLLNGNYFYLNAKPPGENFYTLLPEWPYYLLTIEALMVIFFAVLVGVSRSIAKLNGYFVKNTYDIGK